jgi:prophage antirepressor-like protein
MTAHLMEFIFKDHHIRSVLDEQSAPWFVAKDIFAALDIAWKGSASLKQIPESWVKGSAISGPLYDEKLMGRFPTTGGEQDLITMSEPAVYMIAFRSNKPEAIGFTEWVAGEVLPSIRRTGKYIVDWKPKGGLGHLPILLTKADGNDAFAMFRLVEMGIEADKPVPAWIKDELTMKTTDEIAELAMDGSKLAHHFIKSLFGFDVKNPQLSF